MTAHPDCFPSSGATVLRRSRRRRRGLRRTALAAAAFLASVVCLCLVGGAILFGRLAQGPIALDIAPQIRAALNARIGHGYAFEIGGTAVEVTAGGPALTISRLAVVDGGNRPVVAAPRAAIALDPLKLLLTREISPRRLEITDIDLRLLVLPDGQVAVAAGEGSAAVPLATAFASEVSPSANPSAMPPDPATTATIGGASAPSPATPTNAALRALTAALRSLVDATTSPDAALGALDDVHVSGRLVLDDRTHNATTTFKNTDLSFTRAKDGSAVLQVSADGATGRWTIAARATRGDDGTKSVSVEITDLSLDEITLAGGLRNVGFDFDMPVTANASVRIGADGQVQQAAGRFNLGNGYFKLDDPDHEPLLIDHVSGGFHFDPKTGAVVIDDTELKAGESDFKLSGRLDPPRVAGAPWQIRAEAAGIFGTERPGEKPIRIARAVMNFRLQPDRHRLVVDHVTVDGPEVAFESAGDVTIEGSSVRLNNTSSVRHMPAAALIRLWPSFIAAPVRAWFLANLRGGTVESGRSVVSLDEKDLALMRQQRSVADDHLRVDYAVSGLALNVLNGMPPLADLDGTGVVTGNTSTFTATRGEMEASPGHKLVLVDGTFRAPDTDPKPTQAFIDAHIAGPMDTVADVLSRDAVKRYASVPLDPASVKGQVDAHLGLALKLGNPPPAEEPKVTATATINSLSVDKLVGNEGLSDATVQLVADKSGMHVKGEGQVYGAPATFDLRKPPGGGPGEAVINIALDNAARAKAGLNLGKQLNGVVAAHITTTMGSGDRKQAALDLDFTRASIDDLLPGFAKPAGKPGKATLTVTQRENGTSLDNIVFDGGGASLKGSAELDGEGNFVSARLSQVRLSPGDDLRLEATQSGDATKIVAKGANFDARPFLKWMSAPGNGSAADGADGPKNLDVELHAGVLTGQNGEAMGNADLRVQRRLGQVRAVQLTGRFGRQPISISTSQQSGAPVLVIRSDDAGSSLAFMDLYKRMAGGRLAVDLTLAKGRLEGYATVHDFTLREDPAIKKLAVEGIASQTRSGDSAKLDPSSVSFTKLEAKFAKVGNKVTVEDGALFGPEIGATVKGNIDFARDQLNLQGTFVPLYGLNNLFSQVPLFGPLLGGGKHEGLFGVNYRITGSASQPIMSINPLSVVAPGIFRQVFGAFDSSTQNIAEPRDRAPGPALSLPDLDPSQ